MGQPTYYLPPLPSGAKLKPNSASILFRVRGHASSRWRGSKDTPTSIKLNQALSERRAASVKAGIERLLKSYLDRGSQPASVEAKGDGIWAAPDGGFHPDNNEPITRSATVTVYLTAKSSQIQPVPQPPRRTLALSKGWYFRFNELHFTAVGYANASGKLVLRNAQTGKEQMYSFSLHGGGLLVDPLGWLKRIGSGTSITPAKNVVGEEVYFHTDRPMGFRDFDGELIELQRYEAKWVVGGQFTGLSFNSLGPGAKYLIFDNKFKYQKPKLDLDKLKPKAPRPSVGGARVMGALSLTGPRADDYHEEPRPDVDMVAVRAKDFGGGITVTFPTGKSGYNDIPAGERQGLEDFVRKWASYYEMANR